MIWFLLLLVLALIPASIARSKGRNFGLWYIYGVALWIVAVIHAVVLQPDTKALESQAIDTGDMKKCPFCAELIRAEAKVCRYCGRDLPVPASSAPAMPRIGDTVEHPSGLGAVTDVRDGLVSADYGPAFGVHQVEPSKLRIVPPAPSAEPFV